MAEGLSASLPLPLLAASTCLAELCLDEGDEDDDDEGDDEALSLLQFESKQRLPACGLAASGLMFSLPAVWLRSR